MFEVPALKGLLRAIAGGEVRLVEVESAVPSPFASSLLFDYIATYMYEGDAPAAERRAQALQLDRALLAELLRSDDLRELLDGDAIRDVQAELQGEGRSLDLDRTHDLLRRLGDLSRDELAARGAVGVDELVAARRAAWVRVAGGERLIAAEDAGLYRDALGAVPPVGLPAAFLDPVDGALRRLVGRYARSHGPFTAEELSTRWGVDVTGVLRVLAAEGQLLEGEFRPGGAGTEWVAPDVLRRVRRRTLAAVRRAVEPVEPEALARFLPAWQGIGRDHGRGIDRLRDTVAQLQGIALAVEAWESDVLPLRVPGYTPAMLDELTAGGEVVWIGAGRGRVALHPRSDARLVALPGNASEVSHPILDALRSRGAMFFTDLVAAAGRSERETLAELWSLVWEGVVTNDAWQPLRSGATLKAVEELRPGRSGRRAKPTASLPAARGRWSLVEGLLQPAPAPRERARALAETLLDRHGVVTRAGVLAEGVPGGFSAVYGELRLMEEAGRAQRGYFVEGLGGAQFAVTTAVERLRDVREADPAAAPLVLAAVDPANPYGAALPWPEASRKLTRVAGAWVVLAGGKPALYVERGGRGLVTIEPELLDPAIAALAGLVESGRVRRLAPERVDGEPIGGTRAEELLLEHGFLQGHRKLVLRA